MNTGLHNEPSREVAIAILIEKVKNLEQDLLDAKNEIQCLKRDKDKALKWGIMLLGSAFVSLVVWVGELVASHLVGKQ